MGARHSREPYEHQGRNQRIRYNRKASCGRSRRQDDMEIIGVTKTRPAFGCDLAVRKGYPLYCTFDDESKIAAFGAAGYECLGGLSDLLAVADIVIDCSPGKLGAENKAKYQAAGVKWIFQGGEKHEMTGMSYTSCANQRQI